MIVNVKDKKKTIFIQEPADYVYVRRNEAFANRFIEDFIGKCIEDQFIPDILLEIISELDREVTIFIFKKKSLIYFFRINNKVTNHLNLKLIDIMQN